MRDRIEQSRKTDGPLGIRTGVWFIVFGAVLMCAVMIGLSSRQTSRPSHDIASEVLPAQGSSTRTASFRRTSQREFIPAAYLSGSSYDIDEAQLTMIERMTQD